jgi:hypothetical protein
MVTEGGANFSVMAWRWSKKLLQAGPPVIGGRSAASCRKPWSGSIESCPRALCGCDAGIGAFVFAAFVSPSPSASRRVRHFSFDLRSSDFVTLRISANFTRAGRITCPSFSDRPASELVWLRIRPAFPLTGDQRNYPSRTSRALRPVPACRCCSL